jgi:predicted branched-subunit amino acid permease
VLLAVNVYTNQFTIAEPALVPCITFSDGINEAFVIHPGHITYGSYVMADENWAFALQRGAKAPLTPGYYLGLSLPLYAGWIVCTFFGTIFGGVLQDPARYGLDFAFTAVFLTLLVGMWQGRRNLLPWAASAVVATAAYAWLPGVWYIALGGLAGTLAGALQGPAQAQEARDAV